LAPLAGGVQRLKETPPEIWIRGEQSGHVVQLSADRRDSALFLGQ
jgi:phosphoribosyl-AMP cyclohydrolase